MQVATPQNSSPMSLGERITSRIRSISRLFWLVVIIPTLISIIYYGLIASDVYVSESSFVVRSPQRQSVTGIGSLLQGAGFSRSQDDTYTVQDYMRSRDALAELNKKLELSKKFSSKSVDVFSRFDAFGMDASFEALYKFYQKLIGVDVDSTSSISTLKVSAYEAEDAFRINSMLLDMAERLVNQLNERGRQDMIRFATAEVQVAEQKAKNAALTLSGYRNDQTVFDPERQSTLQFQQIAKLQDDLIANKTQLTQLLSLAPDNPQIPSLKLRIKSLEQQVDLETAKVTGGKSSLSDKSAEFQRLALDREFADKQLGAALASLEQARNEATRKQLYLERIVLPNTPDKALEPKRLRGVLTTLLLGLIVMGILTILLAGVREHKD